MLAEGSAAEFFVQETSEHSGAGPHASSVSSVIRNLRDEVESLRKHMEHKTCQLLFVSGEPERYQTVPATETFSGIQTKKLCEDFIELNLLWNRAGDRMREFGSELVSADEPFSMDLYECSLPIRVRNMNFHGGLYFITNLEVSSHNPLSLSSDVKVATFPSFVSSMSLDHISKYSMLLTHQHGQHACCFHLEKIPIERP